MRAHCLNGLGLVAIDAGRSDEAEELLKTAVAICEETRKTPRPERSFSSTCRLPGSRRLGPARDIFAENLSFARADHDDLDVGMSSHRWKPLVATARAGRIRGAGSEYPAERLVLTVAQVFKLAELVGRRPVGNIRKLPGGGYRLRFQRDGVVRTAQEPDPGRDRQDALGDGRRRPGVGRRSRGPRSGRCRDETTGRGWPGLAARPGGRMPDPAARWARRGYFRGRAAAAMTGTGAIW